MAKKFKDYYNKDYADQLSHKILIHNCHFPQESFMQEVASGIRGKELHERLDVFSHALHKNIRGSYADRLKLFYKILGPKLKTDTGMFSLGWWLWPIGRYVQNYCQDNLNSQKMTLDFIYELTQRFTGEFAIRSMLELQPKQTLSTMKKWSKDDSVHVRRLASEGIRIRLPWAKKIDLFKEYEEDCFTILNNLIESPEKFIQKSVGNNLNDLFKTRPEQAERFVNSWQGSSHQATLWILKHGKRNL